MPNTINTFAVSISKHKVVSIALKRQFTREEAMNLAAWLVTMCDMLTVETDTMTEFTVLVEAIQST